MDYIFSLYCESANKRKMEDHERNLVQSGNCIGIPQSNGTVIPVFKFHQFNQEKYSRYLSYRKQGLTGDGSMTLKEAHQRCNKHGKNRDRYEFHHE